MDTTAIYGIPYVEDADDVKDYPVTSLAIADAIERELGRTVHRLGSAHTLQTVVLADGEKNILNVNVPAGIMRANGRLMFRLQGDHSGAGGGAGWTWRVYLGATKLWDSGLRAFAPGTNSLVRIDGEIVNRNDQAKQQIGGLESAGNATVGVYGGSALAFGPVYAGDAGAVDTTVAQAFRLTVQASSGAITFRSYYASLSVEPAA